MNVFPPLPDLELKNRFQQFKNRFVQGCIRFCAPPIPPCEAFVPYDGKPISGAAPATVQYAAAYRVVTGESIDSIASAMQAHNDPFIDICPWFFDASAPENSGLPSGTSRPWEFLAYFNYGTKQAPELNWLLCLACGFDARVNITRDKKNYLYKGGEVLFYPVKVKSISPLHLKITRPSLKIRLYIEVARLGLPNTGRTGCRVHKAGTPNPLPHDSHTLSECFPAPNDAGHDCTTDSNGVLFLEIESAETSHTLYRLSALKTHVYNVTRLPTPGTVITTNQNLLLTTEQVYLQIILFKDGKPLKGSPFNSLTAILTNSLPIVPKLVRIVVNVDSTCNRIQDLVIDNTVIIRGGTQLITLH